MFVIMMENTGYDTLIGNPKAPFINLAAATTGLAANYYGVAHPSQPNYIGATSGALNGVFDDNDITIDVPNIVDQLESRGKSWRAYMQSYSLCSTPLDHACGNQLYERKHNPFISYKDVQTNAARVGNIVDYSQLVISSRLRFARISGEAFNDSSMLATIQKSWRLGCLGNTCDRRNVKPMTELTGLSGGL